MNLLGLPDYKWQSYSPLQFSLCSGHIMAPGAEDSSFDLSGSVLATPRQRVRIRTWAACLTYPNPPQTISSRLGVCE